MRWDGQLFFRGAEIIDIVYRDSFKTLTFDGNIYQFGLFKCETISFDIHLGSFYI